MTPIHLPYGEYFDTAPNVDLVGVKPERYTASTGTARAAGRSRCRWGRHLITSSNERLTLCDRLATGLRGGVFGPGRRRLDD